MKRMTAQISAAVNEAGSEINTRLERTLKEAVLARQLAVAVAIS